MQDPKLRQGQDSKTWQGQLHIEEFTYDIPASALAGKAVRKTQVLLFDYSRRDPITKSAFVTALE
jgi:hypothetical protein